ncbi:hypothetical protein C0Q70_11005 [Pomacea canaliculata]|uniref:7TM GPCR serpentine receptor class x (Srx) domain-containing protein n=1 Tax=Pomacea canaliculata TaxID=400727 RepID=A0A2T7P4T2_POMCA|nr:hypothetical protein C0Q70_11005 [Pomacea canaliculata]
MPGRGTSLRLTKTETNLSAINGCAVLPFDDFVPWNNQYDIIKAEVFELFQTAVSGVYLQLLFLISAPANILCMIVFYKHGLRERINLCVFSLSLVDFIFITHSFLQHADSLYMQVIAGLKYNGILGFFLQNKLIGFFGFWWASAFITTLIACERCACVVSPLRAHLLLKTKTTAAIIVIATVVIVGLYCVVGARWTGGCVYDPAANKTTITSYESDFFLANVYLVDTLEGVAYGIILPVFCVSVVTAASAITTVKLRHMMEWRQQTSSAATSSSRDVTLTRMLIGMRLCGLHSNMKKHPRRELQANNTRCTVLTSHPVDTRVDCVVRCAVPMAAVVSPAIPPTALHECVGEKEVQRVQWATVSQVCTRI